MSNSVDEEVVEMRFENSQFERGVSTTLSSLDKLRNSLKFDGASKGMSDLQSTANKFNLNPVTASLDTVSKGFLAMSTIAITALSSITYKALQTGQQIVSSFTSAPIIGGLHEYETQLNSIQTILANTGLEGQKGLDRVNQSLSVLNKYSDKTIYNFSEMARNIGTFTAAGVDLDTATSAIKGIANLAALSGSSSAQAATGMYQLSQAISTGTVRLMDWNSVQTAGFGGKVFQEAIKETARAHGVAVDEMIKENGSFRDSLQEGWFSSEILTETLSKFTGDLTRKQIKSMGYTEKQADAIIKQAKVAQDAATKVKTVSQLMGTLQEAMGSGWARTWQMIFGDFNEARGLFTGINNVLSGAITASAKARNKVLGHWKALGGRDLLISSFAKAFDALLDLITPIQKAFRDIFPRQTGKDLFKLTQSFAAFTESLSLGEDTMDNIRRTFRGFFAVLDIGWMIVKGVFSVIADLFGLMSGGSGEVLNFTGDIGDMLVAFDQWLKKGDLIGGFFDNVSEALQTILAPLGVLKNLFFGLFDGLDAESAAEGFDKLGQKLSPLQRGLQLVSDAWDWLIDKLGNAGQILQPIADAFGHIGDAIAQSIAKDGFGSVLDVINTALLGGITILIAKFLGNATNVVQGAGIMKNISGMFGELRDTLASFQTQIQAKTLMLIAGAVGILTASIVALSLVNAADLTKALTAISVGFAQLLTAMKILTLATAEVGFIKMPLMASSMILLGGAILVLSGAVAILAQLSWNELAKGLTGVTVLLLGIAATSQLLAKSSGSMLLVGAAMIPFAIGINILAGAMILISSMSWEEIAKGLVGLAGGLLLIGAALAFIPPTAPLVGAGFALLALGLIPMVEAMKMLGDMKWEEIAKGFVGLGGALLIIAAAMNLMPISLPITAAGLVLVAGALAGIAAVSKIFASMSWQELGKAAAALAGALLIIAGGMYLMTGALPGAAALLVVSAALAVLAPVLVVLGSMSWESIAKGLVALAGTFVVLGLAGLILGPLVPVLLGLGLALVAVGAGMALAGAGALALATAFAIFVAAGTAGIAVVAGMIALIPAFMIALAEGITQFAITLVKNGEVLNEAWVKLLESLIEGAIKIIPKVGKLFAVMLQTALAVIRQNSPAVIETGIQLILNFMEAMRAHIGEIADVAGDLMVNFIKAIGRQATKIQNAAAETIIDFINGTATAIRAHSAELGEAGANLALAIIEGMARGILAGQGKIADAAISVAKSALNAAKDFLKIGSPSKVFEQEVGRRIPEGAADGVLKYSYVLERAVEDVTKNAVEKGKEHARKLSGPAAKDYYALGRYLIKGFHDGLVGGVDDVKDSLSGIRTDIKSTIDSAETQVKDAKERLRQLQKADKKDPKAIAKAHQALKDAKEISEAANKAQNALKNQTKKHQKDLLELGKAWDDVTKKLDDAQSKLDAAIKQRDDFEKSTTNQFDVTPDIAAGMGLNNYLRQIEKKTQQTQKFMETLQHLRDLGLDDASYQQLLAEGLDAQKLMDQLLAGGGASVQSFNQVNANLAAISSQLGNTAAKTLYQAGVDSAQGLVNGFKSQQDELNREMDAIARAMVRAIKKALKIKSPSEEFMAVGEYSSKGLADGLTAYSGVVEKASADLGDVAVESLRVSMSKVGEAFSGNVDMTPVIAPVLDLTRLQKDATKIGTMLTAQPLQADFSFRQAVDISAERQVAQDADVATSEPTVRDIKLEQNNYSPKPLDPVEVYRNTKNLISLAKGALDS